MTITVRPIDFGDDSRPFVDVLWNIYKDDQSWIPTLHSLQLDQIKPDYNPFLRYGQAQLFLAEKHGQPIGRISAHINPRHDSYHNERGGFFGFFECINDQNATDALVEAARTWLRSRDAHWIRGPISFTINQESGTLVEGFDTPPMVGMPHGRPYYDNLLGKTGLSKIKDLFAWHYPVDNLPQRSLIARKRVLSLNNVSIREMNKNNLRNDIGIAIDIFNDAWKDNWGFVPVENDEIDQLSAELGRFADPRLTSIISIDNEPAAMVIAIPNLNEATRDINGRLFPFGGIKVKWRLLRGLQSGRVILLGIRPKFRTRKYAGLHLLLFSEVHLRGKRLGFDWAELGWVLEDNGALNQALPRIGASIYKTYRIYQGPLIDGP